jgi:hypothetical protein
MVSVMTREGQGKSFQVPAAGSLVHEHRFLKSDILHAEVDRCPIEGHTGNRINLYAALKRTGSSAPAAISTNAASEAKSAIVQAISLRSLPVMFSASLHGGFGRLLQANYDSPRGS